MALVSASPFTGILPHTTAISYGSLAHSARCGMGKQNGVWLCETNSILWMKASSEVMSSRSIFEVLC